MGRISRGTLESILDFITCFCYFYGPLLSDGHVSIAVLVFYLYLQLDTYLRLLFNSVYCTVVL